SVRDELARKSVGAKPIFQLPVACAGATSSRKPPSVFAAQNKPQTLGRPFCLQHICLLLCPKRESQVSRVPKSSGLGTRSLGASGHRLAPRRGAGVFLN